MTIRTSRATVTFRNPFLIDGFADHQPAGEYRVDIDEELIESLSFLAYRRVAAFLHLPAISAAQGSRQMVGMTPAVLDAIVAQDAVAQTVPQHGLRSGR